MAFDELRGQTHNAKASKTVKLAAAADLEAVATMAQSWRGVHTKPHPTSDRQGCDEMESLRESLI